MAKNSGTITEVENLMEQSKGLVEKVVSDNLKLKSKIVPV